LIKKLLLVFFPSIFGQDKKIISLDAILKLECSILCHKIIEYETNNLLLLKEKNLENPSSFGVVVYGIKQKNKKYVAKEYPADYVEIIALYDFNSLYLLEFALRLYLQERNLHEDSSYTVYLPSSVFRFMDHEYKHHRDNKPNKFKPLSYRHENSRNLVMAWYFMDRQDYDGFAYYVDKGISLEEFENETIFYQAVDKGMIDYVVLLDRYGYDWIDQLDQYDTLQAAIKTGREDLVGLILKKLNMCNRLSLHRSLFFLLCNQDNLNVFLQGLSFMDVSSPTGVDGPIDMVIERNKYHLLVAYYSTFHHCGSKPIIDSPIYHMCTAIKNNNRWMFDFLYNQWNVSQSNTKININDCIYGFKNLPLLLVAANSHDEYFFNQLVSFKEKPFNYYGNQGGMEKKKKKKKPSFLLY